MHLRWDFYPRKAECGGGATKTSIMLGLIEWASSVAQMVKNLPANAGDTDLILSLEDPLE